MSNPHLPAEMLDHIVDHLHDTEDALRNCCLVSKSWVPRARMHLFADMRFNTQQAVRLWKKTFPDPANSPAHYTKTLYVGARVVIAAYSEVDGWIRGFSSVMHLAFGSRRLFADKLFPPASFHRFSPAIKSLRMTFATLMSPGIFDLILSFPLIKDLSVTVIYSSLIDNNNDSGWVPTAAQPSAPPAFTGSLELHLMGGLESFTRRLLSFPGGLHFRKFTLTWLHGGDHLSTMALVDECSHSLESLDITCQLYGTSIRRLCPNR
jgi:hypothetical protein